MENSQKSYEFLSNEVTSQGKLINQLILKMDGIEALVTHDLPNQIENLDLQHHTYASAVDAMKIDFQGKITDVTSHGNLINQLILKLDGIEALVTHDLPNQIENIDL